MQKDFRNLMKPKDRNMILKKNLTKILLPVALASLCTSVYFVKCRQALKASKQILEEVMANAYI